MNAATIGRRALLWIVPILVLGVAALVVAGKWGYFDSYYEFRSESESVLRDLTAGEERATSAYEDASFPFRETSLLASFVDRADRLTQTLGMFQAIEAVEEVEMLDTIGGKTARIVYDLRFETARTTGELSYLRNPKGQWKLLGYHVTVPMSLADKAKQIDSQYGRIKAPAEVERQVDSILEKIAKGQGAEVHTDAALPFRESKSQEAWSVLLSDLERELGPFQRRLAILSSGQNSAKSKATIYALLQYGKAKTTGTFEFIKVREVWRLLYFKVVIPDPLFPALQN